MDATTIRARFQAAPDTLSDGEEGPVLSDNVGRLAISTAGGLVLVEFNPPSTYNSIGGGVFTGSDVVDVTPGTILDVNGYNASASIRFFQLYNLVAVPPDGAIPFTIPIEVPPSTHFSLTFADGQGQSYSTGLSWASSTTQLVKTLTAVGDMIIEIGFRT